MEITPKIEEITVSHAIIPSKLNWREVFLHLFQKLSQVLHQFEYCSYQMYNFEEQLLLLVFKA